MRGWNKKKRPEHVIVSPLISHIKILLFPFLKAFLPVLAVLSRDLVLHPVPVSEGLVQPVQRPRNRRSPTAVPAPHHAAALRGDSQRGGERRSAGGGGGTHTVTCIIICLWFDWVSGKAVVDIFFFFLALLDAPDD